MRVKIVEGQEYNFVGKLLLNEISPEMRQIDGTKFRSCFLFFSFVTFMNIRVNFFFLADSKLYRLQTDLQSIPVVKPLVGRINTILVVISVITKSGKQFSMEEQISSYCS